MNGGKQYILLCPMHKVPYASVEPCGVCKGTGTLLVEMRDGSSFDHYCFLCEGTGLNWTCTACEKEILFELAKEEVFEMDRREDEEGTEP